MTNPQENHGNSAIEVVAISTNSDFQIYTEIRKEVFVIGQNISSEDEFDEFEEVSNHFLARFEGVACGAARWRNTASGCKLERFAVLSEFRNRGVGKALVKAVIKSIKNPSNSANREIYLHAQESAVGFYENLGFEKVSGPFYECNIKHYKMVKLPSIAI